MQFFGYIPIGQKLFAVKRWFSVFEQAGKAFQRFVHPLEEHPYKGIVFGYYFVCHSFFCYWFG
jgi:uncharacterized protein (UPF0262 family)